MKLRLSSYKKLLLIVVMLLCVIPQSLMAQKIKPKNLMLYDDKPYHFGFIIALNSMSYAVDCKEGYQNNLYQFVEHTGISGKNPITINERVADKIFDDDERMFYNRSVASVLNYGFTVGIVGNLRLGKYFDLRLIPSLSFGSRSLTYNYEIIKNKDFHNPILAQSTTSVLTTIMEFPLHIKYKSKRYNNLAAYVICGGNPKLDFSLLWTNDKKKAQNKVLDFAAEIGAGFDFYTHFFKFGIEAKFSFGLLDVLNKRNNQYDAAINSLRNRMFQLSFTFE